MHASAHQTNPFYSEIGGRHGSGAWLSRWTTTPELRDKTMIFRNDAICFFFFGSTCCFSTRSRGKATSLFLLSRQRRWLAYKTRNFSILPECRMLSFFLMIGSKWRNAVLADSLCPLRIWTNHAAQRHLRPLDWIKKREKAHFISFEYRLAEKRGYVTNLTISRMQRRL